MIYHRRSDIIELARWLNHIDLWAQLVAYNIVYRDNNVVWC